MENRQHHLNLSQWENNLDMTPNADELRFYLDPVGTIPPRAGDIIHIGDLAVFVKEAVEVTGAEKFNWRCVIYGEDVRKLRRRLS
jgi:hypothetical protein